MAKQYYDEKINPSTDWGGDASTGFKQVKGRRVQEFIKEQLTNLGNADASAERRDPSAFGGFVDNVILKNTDAGSDYVKVVYDITRHMFFAVTMEGDAEKYHRQYDKFGVYNNGDFPNAYPYQGKLYVCGTDAYLWDGTSLTDIAQLATEEEVRAIVTDYEYPDEEAEE